MAEYGYYKRVKRRRSRAGWFRLIVRIFDSIMIVLSILCALLLLCTCLSKFINPEKVTFFAFPGLVFPVLYVAGLLLLLYWVVRWRIYAVVMALVLFLGVGNARLFYRMDLTRRYVEHKPSRSEVVVMSYNVMGFSEDYTAGSNTGELVAEFVSAQNIDVLCLQEFPLDEAKSGKFEKMLSDLRYSHTLPYYDDKPDGLGLAIFSRYPISACGNLEADGIQVRPIWADIRVRHDVVRVLNSHLQSTSISDNDVDFLKGRGSAGMDGETRLRGMVRKLSENYKRRAPQARGIADFISESEHPVVVCCDMNDTPLSYSYHTISRRMQDSFVKRGSGVMGTYNGFFNMFRIDYIFMSRELEVKDYFVFDEIYSDHNPVAASLEFSRKR